MFCLPASGVALNIKIFKVYFQSHALGRRNFVFTVQVVRVFVGVPVARQCVVYHRITSCETKCHSFRLFKAAVNTKYNVSWLKCALIAMFNTNISYL